MTELKVVNTYPKPSEPYIFVVFLSNGEVWNYDSRDDTWMRRFKIQRDMWI